MKGETRVTITASLIISFFSLVIAAICCIINVINARRGRRTDDKKETTEFTTIAVRLENISGGITELKSDIRYISTEQQSMRERVAGVEQSVKSAHHRIDRIEGRDSNEH